MFIIYNVKVPRWDLAKFDKVSTTLGSAMTSVGEVMSIGRSFEEAIQKAIRMVSAGQLPGLEGHVAEGKDIDDLLSIPNDKRIWAIQRALEMGYTVDDIHHLTKIDSWFLSKLKRISVMKSEASRLSLNQFSPVNMRMMKGAGFSDRQIASYLNSNEIVVRRKRIQMNVIPYRKQIDTLAAEFPAATNYLYMTFNGDEDDDELFVTRSTIGSTAVSNLSKNHVNGGVMVLGCGAYCIGSSVEFDWCGVSAVRQVRAVGEKAIVVNYNPETVSTDFDESDKLYFEELTLERVLDIYEKERSTGVIVSVGGQIPNNLALPLHQQGVRILGTSPDNINTAEDRHKFSAMLDAIKVDQPTWSELKTSEAALKFCDKVGYPVSFYIVCIYVFFCY